MLLLEETTMETEVKKMKAPRGTNSANIQGHTYNTDKNGIIDVAVQVHVPDLRRHGFVEYTPDVTADDVREMDKAKLIEFIESHGEDVDYDDKEKALRKQALALVK